MMKILLVSTSSQPGGGPQVVWQLARGLQDQGARVEVVLPGGGAYVEKFRQLKIPVYTVDVGAIRLDSFRKFADIMRKGGYDLVHSHGKGAGLYARLVAWRSSCPVVHTHHGIFVERYSRPLKLIYRIYERILSWSTAAIINVSQGQQELCLQLKLFPKSKATVIYNGLSAQEFQPVEQFTKQALRQKLHLKSSELILLYVARMHSQKNHHWLAEQYAAFAHQSTHPSRLILVGDGPLYQQVQQQVKDMKQDTIMFMGHQDNVQEYYQLADVYVSSAAVEGLPVTLIEAQLSSLPALVSNVVGNNEVVVPDQTGLLFDLDQPEQFISKLNALSDPTYRHQLAAGARQQAIDRFSLDQFISEHDKLYKRIIGI